MNDIRGMLSSDITVPCCEPCNGEFQKHDEYFRIAITTGIDREKFPRESADSVRAINNLARPASLDFARRLLKNYQANPSRLTYDVPRIGIVLHRTARGLFFHRRNFRMPGTIALKFCIVDKNAEGWERINRQAGNLTTIGPGTFRYSTSPSSLPTLSAQFG